jgi:hypothetical protein
MKITLREKDNECYSIVDVEEIEEPSIKTCLVGDIVLPSEVKVLIEVCGVEIVYVK